MANEARRARRLFLPALLSVLVFGCPAHREREAVLRVGVIAPLTGFLADLGVSCLEGADLAVQPVNRKGGLSVAGRRYRVELVLKNCRDRPEAAVSAAQELINRDMVSAIVGPPLSGLA